MAAPVSTPPVPNPIVGVSSPSPQSRWGRSGEPGSAFNGLSRAGRGRGHSHGRGRGGGRGGRGGATTREAKIGDTSGDKKIDPTTAESVSTANAASKPESVSQPSGRGRNSVPPNLGTSKPKAPSRRASRTIPIPAVAVTQSSPSAPPSPTSTRPSQRKRRSQGGKPNTLLNVNSTFHDDNLRNRIGSAPHSAPVKDTPPHLTKPFDMRNNIDALVERVRAVAMADNRPSTPGSHIDWAGDDDDSLPDLDDWGLTPTISAGEKAEMSPIIVDGLKSLPELVTNRIIPPAEQGLKQPINGDNHSSGAGLSEKDGNVLSAASQDTQSNFEDNGKVSKTASANLVNNTVTCSPRAAGNLTRSPLHPSLPAKPTTSSETSIFPKSRHGPAAMPMRNPSPQKKFNISADKLDSNVSPPAAQSTGPPEEPGTLPEEQGGAHPLHAPPRAPPREDLHLNDNSSVSAPPGQKSDPNKEGLSASIHAPKTLLESASAPADLVSHPTTIAKTHTRAHTVGKLSVPRVDSGRPSRSGYSSPRGGISSGGHHARTHSSPPAGAMLNNHRSLSSQRPVLTGEAISRLARTIGGTALSPPRAVPVITGHD